MKKVLLTILIIILIAVPVGGTVYFYIQNKNQISANEQLAAQNATVQAQLNAIGQMVDVYQVNKKVYSGNEILEGDLITVSIPASTLADSSVTDKALLIGNHYRVDVKPGTILSLDMLMDEDTTTMPKFPYELTLESLPVSTVVGDYIDIRFVIPTGEEYVVLNHKKIERIYNTTITLHVSEEESAILMSMLHDIGTYNNACAAYAVKYLEPGNSDSVAYYPVQHDMENYIRFNPNIEDTTRCINDSLRDHIDETFLVYSNSANSSVAGSFISTFKSQLSGQIAAHNTWLTEHTDEDGNVVGEQGTSTGDGTTSGDTSIENQTGEAMDQIEEDIQDLEEIM